VPNQTFHFGQWIWDVDKAANLVVDKDSIMVDVSALIGYINRGIIGINRKHVDSTDPDSPGIIAPIDVGGQTGYILIDGWHRLYKAHLIGRAQFAVKPLSESESNSCLIRKPSKRIRR
jgi:hypothetical protein